MPISADPFGLPRPINPANFFDSTKIRWLGNRFWVPEGPLACFRTKVFDPYAKQLEAALQTKVPGLSVKTTTRPQRYVFMLRFTALDMRKCASIAPTPPVVTLVDVINELALTREEANPEDLLDLLTTIQEDLTEPAFTQLATRFSWVSEYLR
jgi:hypothetical protein